jgi:hypothetical protein
MKRPSISMSGISDVGVLVSGSDAKEFRELLAVTGVDVDTEDSDDIKRTVGAYADALDGLRDVL